MPLTHNVWTTALSPTHIASCNPDHEVETDFLPAFSPGDFHIDDVPQSSATDHSLLAPKKTHIARQRPRDLDVPLRTPRPHATGIRRLP